MIAPSALLGIVALTLGVPAAGPFEHGDHLRISDGTIRSPEPSDLSIATRATAIELAAADDSGEKTGRAPEQPSLDFDLLGPPRKTQAVDEEALWRRRKLLAWHQGVGLGLLGLQVATTVVGQLNYSDKFGVDNTGKYVQPHAILAYSTLAAFAAAGTLALLAPNPLRRDEGFDRVSLHKVSMAIATAGMLAQGVVGIWTQSREGHLNQETLGTVHLAIGYATLAAVAVGVGALVI